MNTRNLASSTVASFARAVFALTVIALGITGIAALLGDNPLSLEFVFGKQLWVVWVATSALLLTVFACVVFQLNKSVLVERKDRFCYRHC